MRDLVLGLACLVVGFGSAPAGADCLDRAFADNGWSLEPPGAAAALVRQADGKLLVAGQVGDFYHSRFLLARYDVNGALDPTFGTGGTVETSFGGGGDKSSAFAVALQADGKIVAVGSTEPYTGSPPVLFGPAEVALARYETNGVLDATFGTAGQVTSPFPAATTAHGVVVQPGGRIVVAGASATGAFGADQFFFARYDADGTLDPTFGSGGSVVLGSGSANALVRQADGKLAAAGFVHSGGIDHFALARVDGDGVPDAMFGSGGTVVTDATPSGGQSDGEALVVQDGKLVAAGYRMAGVSRSSATTRMARPMRRSGAGVSRARGKGRSPSRSRSTPTVSSSRPGAPTTASTTTS